MWIQSALQRGHSGRVTRRDVLLQADLAALWHGVDALLQWQAEAAAQAAAGGYAVEVPAVQTAFQIDLGIKANLQQVTQVLQHIC